LEEERPNALEMAKKAYEKRKAQEAGKINSISYNFYTLILLFYSNKQML